MSFKKAFIPSPASPGFQILVTASLQAFKSLGQGSWPDLDVYPSLHLPLDSDWRTQAMTDRKSVV